MGLYTRECPACGSTEYEYYPGAHDFEGPPLEPDTSHCAACGFDWSQVDRLSEDERAAQYAESLTPKPD